MKVVGTMVFVLAVIVHSIVCPARRQTLRAIQALAEELPGVYVPHPDRYDRIRYPVETQLNVVAKGNIIIGRDVENHILPIYDSKGHFITMEIESKEIRIMKPDEFEYFGIFNPLPDDTLRLEEFNRERSRSPRNRFQSSGA